MRPAVPWLCGHPRLITCWAGMLCSVGAGLRLKRWALTMFWRHVRRMPASDRPVHSCTTAASRANTRCTLSGVALHAGHGAACARNCSAQDVQHAVCLSAGSQRNLGLAWTHGLDSDESSVQGAATTVYAALADGLEDHSGAYLQNCQVGGAAKAVEDLELAAKLWHVTEQEMQDAVVKVDD